MKALILTVLLLTPGPFALAESYNQQAPLFSAEQVQSIQMKLYKANCFPIPADVDPAPLCAPDHLWGLGGVGGFYCCQHPPT